NMSHELRTPLNSSLILSKLLSENRDGNLSPEQVKFAQNIYSAGNDLLNLINDILDLSKIEAGKMDIKPEVVGLIRLADSLDQMFRPSAEQKSIRFSVTVDEDTPSIETDPQRLEQILKNLVRMLLSSRTAERLRSESPSRKLGTSVSPSVTRASESQLRKS